MTILLAGATGLVGGATGLKLRKAGLPVVALLRQGKTHPKAHALADAGMEIVEGDLARPESLGHTAKNCEVVITTVSSMPSGADDGLRRVDLEGTLALIESAERAGVKRFVYVSYSGNIREDSPLETAKRKCENHLLESTMEAVILRPSYFMEKLDAVHIFEQGLNRKIKVDHIPVEALQTQHQSSDPLQKTFAALMLSYAKGDVIEGTALLAQQHQINLRSVRDHANGLSCGAAGATV